MPEVAKFLTFSVRGIAIKGRKGLLLHVKALRDDRDADWNPGSIRAYKLKLVFAQETGAGLPVKDSALQSGTGRQRVGVVLHQHVATGCAEMQFDVADFFHGHGVNAIRARRHRFGTVIDIETVAKTDALVRSRFRDHILRSCFTASARVQDIEVAAAESFAVSCVVERIPGNRVDAVGQGRRIQVDKADRAHAIRESREQIRDVGKEIIVGRMHR